MSEPVRILIVEDVPSDFDLAQREIHRAVKECVIQRAQTREEFLRALHIFQPDLILSDYYLPGFDGLTALRLTQEHAKLTPFIIWTGTIGEDVAVECMKAGAVNYILKENIKRLGAAVIHALEERRLLLEHKRAAELVQNNEKRFRALIENGLDNISLLGADGTLLWESPATVRMLGYDQDEYIGQNIFQLMHPDDLARTSDQFTTLLQESGSRQQGIFRLRHQDGSWRWTEAVATNLLHDPSIQAIVINYRDITERKQAEERLQQERNLLRTLIDHLPDRIYVMDAEGRKTLSNTADWKASGGKTMEDVIGKTDFDTYPPELAEEFWALDKSVLDSGKPVINYEEPGLDDTGNPVWVLTTKVPLRDRRGEITGLVGIGRNITERKQTEEKLRLSDQILQRVHALVLVADSQGSIIYVSPAAKDILGYEPEELLGDNWWKRSRSEPAQAAREKDYLSRAARGEIPISAEPYERAIQDRSGNTRWISWVDAMGEGRTLIGIGHDITERKKSADQLNYHARLLRHINDAVIATDGQFRITAWNRAAEKMYGWSREEVMGNIVSEVLNSDLSEEQRAENQELLKQSNVSREQRIYQRRDGRTIYVEANTIALVDDEGKFTGYVSVNRDITERKKAEKELHESELKYRNLVETSHDLIWTIDAQGLITYLNQASRQIYGYEPEELIGQSFFELMDPKHYHLKLDEFKKTIANGNKFVDVESIVRHRDGRQIILSTNSLVLRDNDKNVIGVVGTSRDITDRKRAEEQAQLQIQRLKALRAIDVAISSSFNLNLTLDFLLDQVIAQLNVDSAAVLMLQPITGTLVYAAGRGFRTPAIREVKVRMGEGYSGRAVLERRTIHLQNLMEMDSGPAQAIWLKSEEFKDYHGVPLIVKGEVKGVLEIFHRNALDSNPEWLDFLETLAGQAVIAIENTSLFENLQRSNRELFQAYDATIEGWSRALDLRDRETEGHTQRVTELTMDLARRFGFTEEQLINIRWGALLHDIGKMGVPDNILFKPGTLTDEEWEVMKRHTTFALEMLSPIGYLKSSLDIPYCHHEKWDGTGYPRGLKGEVIPLAARLFAVVDVWDALRSDRPYRKGWNAEKTIEHIRSQAGTHFEPQVVEKFLDLVGGSNG